MPGFFGNLSGWHLLAVVFLVLLLFGAPKLPGLAKSLGQSMKIFRSEVKNDKGENAEKADAPGVAANEAQVAPAQTQAAPSTDSSAKP